MLPIYFQLLKEDSDTYNNHYPYLHNQIRKVGHVQQPDLTPTSVGVLNKRTSGFSNHEEGLVVTDLVAEQQLVQHSTYRSTAAHQGGV